MFGVCPSVMALLKHRLSAHLHIYTHTMNSDVTDRMSERCVKRAFWLLVSLALLDLCFAGPRPSHREPQRHHKPGTWGHNNPILNDQGQQRIHFPSLSDLSVQRIYIPSLGDLDTQRIEIPLLDDGQVTQVNVLRLLKSWISCFRVSNLAD